MIRPYPRLSDPFGLMKLCPVCGWPQPGFFSWCLGDWVALFCDCCGTEFGVGDVRWVEPLEQSHARLRELWLAEGAPWAFERPGLPPPGWEPHAQIEGLLRHPGWRAEWYAIEAERRVPMRDLATKDEEIALVDLRSPDARIAFERTYGTGRPVRCRALVRRRETVYPSSVRVDPLETTEPAGVEVTELGHAEAAELDARAELFRPRIDSEEWPLRGDPSDAPVLDRVLSSSGTLRALHQVWPHDAYDIAGAYVGRLIIEATGGRWVAFKDDLRAELGAMVVLPTGERIWPFQRIHKRATNPVWSLTSYMVGLGLLEPARGEYLLE